MTASLAAGLALALASTTALSAGFLLQHGAASALPRLELRQPLAAARALAGAPRWLAGFATGLAGWALYVLALALAPLSLVQAVAAGGVGLLVLLGALARRRAPARRETLGAVVATLGLAALGLSLAGEAGTSAAAVSPLRVAGCAVLVAAAAALLARRGAAAAGGIAAGLLYGLADVATKALLVALPAHVGLEAVLAQPYLYLALLASAAAFALLQQAFQHGRAVATVAPMTAATNLLPMAAGVLVLGDQLPSSLPLLALRLAAFAAAAVGALAA